MIRLIALLALLITPASASAFCLLGCDTVLTGPEAATGWTQVTSQPMPPGMAVTHLLVGGFQDTFVQLRATANDPAVAAVQAQFGLKGADFTTESAGQTTISEADWWQPDVPGTRSAAIVLPGFAYATLILTPGEGDNTIIYLIAFET